MCNLVTPEYESNDFQFEDISRNTWIINSSNSELKMKRGPSLNIARESFSCSKMESNGKIFLVVAGGYGSTFSSLDSVEILEPFSDKGWTTGNKWEKHYTQKFEFLI